MNPRIEKKLSKRLVQTAPSLFTDAWIDRDVMASAWNKGVRVSHVWSVGGGVDYWGEGEDAFTAWEWWAINWEWNGDFEPYPEGHLHEHHPNIEGFKATTRNLLRLARDCAARTK